MKKLKYYFSPRRWRSFTIWILRSILKKIDDSEWTPEIHEVEQYMYRYQCCIECVSAGHCVHSDCKCKMPARAHVRTDFCPTYRWGPFMPKEAWEVFMEENEIIFSMTKKSSDV